MQRAVIRRFAWLAIALGGAALAITCTAEVQGSGVSDDDPKAKLQGQFNSDVLPLMNRKCAECHAGSMPLIGWMATSDDYPSIYSRVTSWPALVDLIQPELSRLITQGAHEGPAWTPEEIAVITPWLQAEADFGASGDAIDTMPLDAVIGANEFDLGAIGVNDAAGCLLRFTYDASPPIVKVDDLRVQGDADGCVLVEPVVGLVTDPNSDGNTTLWYDPDHQFQGQTITVNPNQETPIGDGSITVTWVPSEELNGTIQVQFRFYGAQPTAGGGGGGADAGM